MTGFRVLPLHVETWPAFADLVTRDGGVWGGCWWPLGKNNWLVTKSVRAAP